MEQMDNDLRVIDATATTEKLNKQMTADEAEAVNDLADLMGEPAEDMTQVKAREAAQELIARYELGHVIKLKRPVSVGLSGGQIKTIEEVTFHNEPETRHIQKLPIQMDTWTFAHQLTLIGACTGLSAQELLAIKTCDLMPLMEVAISFFSVGPKGGN